MRNCAYWKSRPVGSWAREAKAQASPVHPCPLCEATMIAMTWVQLRSCANGLKGTGLRAGGPSTCRFQRTVRIDAFPSRMCSTTAQSQPLKWRSLSLHCHLHLVDTIVWHPPSAVPTISTMTFRTGENKVSPAQSCTRSNTCRATAQRAPRQNIHGARFSVTLKATRHTNTLLACSSAELSSWEPATWI